jgi:carbon storage regulator
MLVLARKRGESVQIGDRVSVEIVEVRGGKVRLGITAPRETRVCRMELLMDSSERDGKKRDAA